MGAPLFNLARAAPRIHLLAAGILRRDDRDAPR
jgi:hypothetical protein